MEYQFVLRGIKPLSLNDSYTYDKHKTTETQQWLYLVKQKILSFPQQVLAIQNNFREGHDYLTVFYRYFLPRRKFFTAKVGNISRFTVDWSNVPKLLDDKIFNEILGIDDSQVQRGAVEKLPWNANYHCMIVTIKVRKLSELMQRSALILPECLKNEV